MNKRLTYLIYTCISFILILSCNDNPYKQSKRYYTQYCANCHMENGEGLRGLIPPLAKADYIAAHRSEIPCHIRVGVKGAMIVNGVPYGQQEMPPIAKLTEFEITNIMNYIGTSWGNTDSLWTVEEVRKSLMKCK
jgi:mono/diheme cytochrome c family protein